MFTRIPLRRALATAAVLAVATTGVLLSASPASAATTSPLTVRLVTPAGVAVGGALDSTASINVEATNPEGVDDFNEYYAANDDPADYPDSTRMGALTGGVATFDVPRGDDVYVSTSGGPGYLATYEPHKVAAKPLNVSVKTVHGAVVTGHVVNPTGAPLPGATVTVFDQTGFRVLATTSDASGGYRLEGIPTGTYRIQFNSPTDEASPASSAYVWNYWKNASRWAQSTGIKLSQQGAKASFTTRTGVDDAVVAGHTMTVTTAFKTPSDYSGATLAFIPVHHGQADWAQTKLAADGASGAARLAPNTYVVEIFTPDHNWYWTGNGTHVTADFKKAKLIGFDGTQNVRILFN